MLNGNTSVPMADECKKACLRRSTIRAFTEYYIAGKAIDIGAGNDGLSHHAHLFPKLTDVFEWDLPQGDAQVMPGIEKSTFGLVHSSHALEHMRNPWTALHRWYEILKPMGHMVIVVPEFWNYEQPFDQYQFPPSSYNPDHKAGFTLRNNHKNPCVYNMAALAHTLPDSEILRLESLDWTLPEDRSKRRDYSSYDGEEPSIEIVIRKRNA